MRRFGFLSRALPLFGAAVALLAAGCSKKTPEPPRDTHVAEAVRVASVYSALAEKPDARRVLLLGPGAKALADLFLHALVEPCTTARGRFGLIVVDCADMSRESCARAKTLLTENGVLAWLMDVRDVDFGAFRSRISSFDFPDVHLWMPGATRWLLVGRQKPEKQKLAPLLQLFTREDAFADLARARCASLPEVFAGYVGTRADFEPALGTFNEAKAEVKPEYFLTKEIPRVEWIAEGEDVDPDIRKAVFAEIRSMQVVRRLVVEGNLASAAAKDRKGEAKATEIWARAMKRNPGDAFLLERLDNLERNAEGFLRLGKVLQAMKCYETMILIRPEDPKAVHNFGMCLKRLGKADLAERILRRADDLSRRL